MRPACRPVVHARAVRDPLLLLLLLLDHDLLHLLNRHRAFDVDPLVVDDVLVPELEHQIDTPDVREGDEAESPRFVRVLVEDDHAVVNVSEVGEVGAEGRVV